MTKNQKERLTFALAARRERPDDQVVGYRLERLAREVMRVPKNHRPEDEPLPIDDVRASALTEIFRLDEGAFGLDCLRALTCEPELEIDASTAAIEELVEAVRSATLATDELDAYYGFIEELRDAIR
jgi:hypothetical protein